LPRLIKNGFLEILEQFILAGERSNLLTISKIFLTISSFEKDSKSEVNDIIDGVPQNFVPSWELEPILRLYFEKIIEDHDIYENTCTFIGNMSKDGISTRLFLLEIPGVSKVIDSLASCSDFEKLELVSWTLFCLT
jgi:hypothetical protein